MQLKQFFEENHLKISHVANQSGLPYTTVSELVNGKKSIEKCNVQTVYTLAKYLNTTIEELLVSEDHSGFSDKYSLTKEQSLFLSKKKWDENVYCGMKMENRNITFPQTKTILDGINVPAVSLDDVLAIRNMRDAWQYIMNSGNLKLDLDYICRLNGFISRNESIDWGVLRTGNVGISGCSYKPAVPVKEKVEGDLRRILSSYKTTTEKALELFCFITYNQLFWDGNKRTALTAANKLLLDSGCGMLTITDDKMQHFNELLLNMYRTGEKDSLKKYLYDNAVIGIELFSHQA